MVETLVEKYYKGSDHRWLKPSYKSSPAQRVSIDARSSSKQETQGAKFLDGRVGGKTTPTMRLL